MGTGAGVEVEHREERGAGEGKERKLWPGLHLGSKIFITRLQEQGQHCFPGDSSLHPGSALKCTSPGRLGAAGEASERRGQRKLKGRKNKLAHLGFPVLLGASFLTCSSRTAFDGGIPIFQAVSLGPVLGSSSPSLLQENFPRVPVHTTSLFHEFLQLPSLRILDSADNSVSSLFPVFSQLGWILRKDLHLPSPAPSS